MNNKMLMATVTFCSVLCLMSTVIVNKSDSGQKDSEINQDFTVGYLTLDSDVVKVSDTSIDSLDTNLPIGKFYYIGDKDDSPVRFAIYYSPDSMSDSEESKYDFGRFCYAERAGKGQCRVLCGR